MPGPHPGPAPARPLWPGLIAVCVPVLVVAGALAALVGHGDRPPAGTLLQDPYLRRVVRFTFLQAALSTLLSVGLAIPVARALARRPAFAGREWLLRLYGLPLVVPSIVAVLGVVQVFGVSGILNRALQALGLPVWHGLYGLPGILIAHVFFNLPLAVRMLLPLWATVPGETWRLASQLGLDGIRVWRWIEWPLLRQALPAVATLVFMLCFTSFAVVLALGGGPAATTLEVAIYQALRFDFDPPRAVLLALTQLAVCGTLAVALYALQRDFFQEPVAGRPAVRPDTRTLASCAVDVTVLVLATALVVSPLAMVAWSGIAGPLPAALSDPALLGAAQRSLAVALPAGTLALVGGVATVLAVLRLRLDQRAPVRASMLELAGSMILVCPPLVIGAGLFLLLMPYVDVLSRGLALVVLINALMAMPFVIRILAAPARAMAERNDRLCASLGLTGWHRLRRIEWPLLRRPVGLALALAVCLSLGDLGAIALFGTPETTTLPLLLYQRMAGYRMGEAAVAALMLVGLCLALFTLLERGVGGRHV